ncbi:hypothetical protein QUB70_22565 [Microcoleus sp. A003_D6]|uniref:hypothetical protein n=1 Tax=Microcoleus sp. A003_D6 TaxID=3055266 RepID=UPI002FD3AA50
MITDIFALIPVVALGILFLIFQKRDNCWRNAILSAAIVGGVIVALSTEFFSLFRLLTFEWVFGLWLVADILLLIFYLKFQSVQPIFEKNQDEKFPSFLVGLLGGVLFIFAAVGLIAVVAPPNNWDSMTYHMSRVVHWMQNRSVEHYPTSYVPQLYHPPWAEFAIMHFQILSGGDRFANLVQWLSMVGSAIAVSLIAKQLGANVRGQVFAAVFAATLPMGILQGSSTQNDYAVCFWVVCFVSCGLAGGMSPGITGFNTFKIGASLGLAILTKTTAYIFCLPSIIWFIVGGIKCFRGKMLRPILIIAAVTLVLNIGHFWRNYDLFGYAIGSPQDFTKEYKIEVFTLPNFLSNVIRNLGMQAGTRISRINGAIAGVINILHRILGVATNDPRITWPPGQVFAIATPSFNRPLAKILLIKFWNGQDARSTRKKILWDGHLARPSYFCKRSFRSRSQIEVAYNTAVDFVKSKNCTNTGLSFWAKNAWEYPLWVMFPEPGKPAPRIEHISTIDPVVKQKLNSEPYKSFTPCAIIYFARKNDGRQGKEMVVKNQTYLQKWSMEPLSVFVKK